MGTLLALAFLWAAAQLDEGIAFAPAAIADAIVRLTPGDATTFLIEALGPWAMRLLALAVGLGTIAVGAEIYRRTASDGRPSPWRGALLLAVLAAAVSGLVPSDDAAPVPTGIALMIAAAVYELTARRVHHQFWLVRGDADKHRRYVLRLGAATAAGVVVGGASASWFARRFGGPDTDIALVAPERPAIAPAREPFPEIDGLSPEITSVADHYVVDIDIFDPTVEAEGWRLRVGGLVDEPLELDVASLQADFEVVEEFSVMTCISNEVGGGLVGNSAWGGVRLTDVLERAGVSEGAVDVVLRAADGYADSIPLSVAMEPFTLLAVSHNGAPLTQEHGFPCRLRVPSIYGMKNVKWLTDVEVVAEDYQGYWMDRGWSDEAVVKTESRIDVAGIDRAGKVGEETWVAGVAWAGSRGISKVEVSTDDGVTWQEALLKEPLAPNAWRLWAYRWTPARAGRILVLCRATDGDGVTQTKKTADPHPSGASGYHGLDVEVS
ncbi:MAG: molybdopterin-dependent oxidoreductase [Actinomycetota bacterium]|nr:molybdopterin-dependent oxidoreductase [Actinomycetota bacterium]